MAKTPTSFIFLHLAYYISISLAIAITNLEYIAIIIFSWL